MYLHSETDSNKLYCGDVMDWRSTVEPKTVKLLHIDGPYDMRKAEWDILTGSRETLSDALTATLGHGDITPEQVDRLSAYVTLVGSYDRKGADLIAWYAPVLASLSQSCALSASCYLWNTDSGEALLRPVMQMLGWTWRGCVKWDKGSAAMAGKVDTEGLRCWYDVTEACGFYQREDESPFPALLTHRRETAKLTRKDLAKLFPSKTGGLTGCVLNWEAGYNVPTREQWVAMMHRIQEEARNTMPARSGLEYDHLRAEYEASRPPFTAPLGVSNVWSAPTVPGRRRLKHARTGETHPCEKPLTFAERILRASSDPGDLVMDAFAGTCRLAMANGRSLNREERREVVSVDIDSGWFDAALGCLSTKTSTKNIGTDRAPSLFDYLNKTQG